MEAISLTCNILFMIFLVPVVTGSPELEQGIKGIEVTNLQDKIGSYWPMGIVTYYLDNNTYDLITAHQVQIAMNVLESASCVRFGPVLTKPTGNITWIHITNPQRERNCVHAPRYMGTGEIIVVLGFDCLKEREILHTLLHGLGFNDEVTHPQRDQYIRVLWNNIQPEYRSLYSIQTNDDSSKLMVEYDPLSIMHFHDRAFSVNGQATIMPLVPGLLISPSDELSQLDKMRMRLLFDHECNRRKVGNLLDKCKMAIESSVKIKDNEVINNGYNNGVTEEVINDISNNNDSRVESNQHSDEATYNEESKPKVNNDENINSEEAADKSEGTKRKH